MEDGVMRWDMAKGKDRCERMKQDGVRQMIARVICLTPATYPHYSAPCHPYIFVIDRGQYDIIEHTFQP